MLASLDSSLTTETRRAAAQLANEFLEDIECKEYCRNVLLSQPLPKGVELEKCAYSQLAHWAQMKNEMIANQAPLLAIWTSWNKIEQDRSIVQADEDMASLFETLIARGVIVKLSASILKNDVSLFNQAIVDFALGDDVRQSYGAASPQLLAALRSELQNQGLFKKENLNLFPDYKNVEKSPQVRWEDSTDLNDHEIFAQVKKQQDGIRKLLYTGNLANVDRAVNELLVFHGKYGKTEHLAKTLCSLSKMALEANEAHLADLFITKAVELQLEDIVIYTSRADVSKNLGRFAEAAKMYEDVLLKYGNQKYALCGYADTLKDQGKLDDAEKIYGTAIELFPDDRPAQIGKASVLILLGRESEATALLSGLELESEVDWFAYHTLCISIVKSQKLDDAIEKLEEAIQRVPWQKLKNYFADTLGYAMLRKGNAVKAIASFRNGLAIADHAKKSGILLLMSSAYTELGQRKKSLEFWRMARPTTRDAINIKSSLKKSRGRGIAGSNSLPDSELETATLDLLLGMAA